MATESVWTPAGTFDSFRIEPDGGWHVARRSETSLAPDAGSPDDGRFHFIGWYVPRAGRLVRFEEEVSLRDRTLLNRTVFELDAFDEKP